MASPFVDVRSCAFEDAPARLQAPVGTLTSAVRHRIIGRMSGSAALEFRLLGPLEVWRAGRPLRLGGERQRALLALLLLHANEVVPSQQLIEELFGDDASDTGANALQVGVSRLRRLLGNGRTSNGDGGVVVTNPPGYLLRAEPEQLD